MKYWASIELPEGDIPAALAGRGGAAPSWFYRDVDGVREIGITGALYPVGDEALGVIGYDWILDAINGVDSVRLFIDSPGGVVHPALERIMRRLQGIDSEAIITGTCASAAYFIGRSCKRLISDGYTTEVGGIGAYVLLWDFGEANKNRGVRPIKIKIGEMKGIGAGGEYTQAEIDEVYRELKDIFDGYMNILGSKYAQFADGRVYTAVRAFEMGLIDGVTPAIYTGEDAMANDADDVIVEQADACEQETQAEACEVEMKAEEPVKDVEQKAEEPVEEKVMKKLPVRRVSDDFAPERLFYKLLEIHKTRTAAWAALERINQEAYMKLRNKLHF